MENKLQVLNFTFQKSWGFEVWFQLLQNSWFDWVKKSWKYFFFRLWQLGNKIKSFGWFKCLGKFLSASHLYKSFLKHFLSFAWGFLVLEVNKQSNFNTSLNPLSSRKVPAFSANSFSSVDSFLKPIWIF